jgi:hypothetical protein
MERVFQAKNEKKKDATQNEQRKREKNSSKKSKIRKLDFFVKSR